MRLMSFQNVVELQIIFYPSAAGIQNLRIYYPQNWREMAQMLLSWSEFQKLFL